MFGPGPRRGARRCSDCNISYPTSFALCEVCGKPTWYNGAADPDEDWKELAAWRKKLAADEQATEKARYPHPPDATCQVREIHGRLWISHDKLIELGYLNLEAGSIVFVNNTFYELEGFNGRGFTRNWWVSELETEGVFDALTPDDFKADG